MTNLDGNPHSVHEASYARGKAFPRPSSLAVQKNKTNANMLGDNSARSDYEHSDSDANIAAPALTETPNESPNLHPLQRTGALVEQNYKMTKSSSSSRMAFIRRPKRNESAVMKARRTMRDQDNARGDDDDHDNTVEDPGISFVYEGGYSSQKVQHYAAVEENFRKQGSVDASPAVPVPEGALKKRVTRIERSIAEQSAWVRSKFDLDESDTLLESCSAALVQKIMLQGRLHITNYSICFYAKIFGIVTKERWPFSTIQSVRKRRGGFVANSIKISFTNPETHPVIIASLNRREQTLAIISSRLNLLSPSAPNRAGGVEEDSESAEDFHSRFGADDRSTSSTPQCSMSDAQSHASGDGPNGYRYGPGGSDSTSEDLPQNGWDKVQKSEKRDTPITEGVAKSALDSLIWASPGEATDKIFGKEYNKRTEQARAVFDVPIIFVFNHLFVSDWAKTYLSECNNLDVQMSEWYRADDGVMTRDVSFRRPLGYRIGPKETRVKETQRYSFTSDGGVRIELEGHNLDAPFGDYFVVESYFELKPTNGGSGCEIVTSIAVHFMKSTMLRSKIEAGALAETKLTFAKLIELGNAHLSESVSDDDVSAFLQKGPKKKLAQSKVSSKTGNNGKPVRPSTRKPQKEKKHVAEKEYAVAEETRSEIVSRKTEAGIVQMSNNMHSQASPTIIQMHDTTSSHLLRVIAIASLVMVCILLVLVLMSFRRMKHEFQVLQTIVREMQTVSVARSAENVCNR